MGLMGNIKSKDKLGETPFMDFFKNSIMHAVQESQLHLKVKKYNNFFSFV